MEEYLDKYDSLNKIIVYDFKLGDGGVGDLLKFFMYLVNYGVRNNIKIHYLINDILIENYLKLIYHKLYIKYEDMNNIINIKHESEMNTLQPNIYYLIKPSVLYNIISYETSIPYELLFDFHENVKINCQIMLDHKVDNYISLHLRLGDKYLETDQKYIQCLFDTRKYYEDKIFKFIEENHDKNIIFFCDNQAYKLKIKEKYDNIIITNCEIGHTSLINTTEKQVLDSITEFYLMTNSDKIIMASNSGFPITASKFKNILLECLY
jgi:hypothetical protein